MLLCISSISCREGVKVEALVLSEFVCLPCELPCVLTFLMQSVTDHGFITLHPTVIASRMKYFHSDESSCTVFVLLTACSHRCCFYTSFQMKAVIMQ
jgi:hypothetical protein